ncbi:hypothetical protein [Brevibacillus borstelensis]|uniref:hypothetical protein n=1 Tax=Brevibacillus borstelensis TaxID=45462 RepID=UPI0030C3F02A
MEKLVSLVNVLALLNEKGSFSANIANQIANQIANRLYGKSRNSKGYREVEKPVNPVFVMTSKHDKELEGMYQKDVFYFPCLRNGSGDRSKLLRQ